MNVKEFDNSGKILIKDLKLYAYHGAISQEKELGQFFLLDLTVHTDFSEAIKNDSAEKTLNYTDIIEFLKIKFIEKKFNLIESAANFLCNSLLEKFQNINKITLTIKKPNAPINAEFSYVAAEITKTRL